MVLGSFVLIEMQVFQLHIIIKKFQDRITHLFKMAQAGKKSKPKPKPKNQTKHKTSPLVLGNVCTGNDSL